MQDAYFVDQQQKGDWKAIGYTAPASSNFTYSETGDWKAVAKFSTDGKCKSDDWTVTVTVDNTAKTISYQASDNCPALTPNFKNIGTSS